MLFCHVKGTLQRPCQVFAIVHTRRSFLLFQPFRVHFLTFIDNYPICQRSSSHACSLSWRAVAGFVSVVSFSFTGAKLRLLYCHTKQFWEKV